MILDRFPEIQKLTKAEQVELYCELLDLLAEENELLQPDPEIVTLLEGRYQDYLANPELARPVEEVMARLRAKYIERKKEAAAEAHGT